MNCNNECVNDGICNHNEECMNEIVWTTEQMRLIEQIRADEQKKVLDKAYEMLGNELVWVLREYGDDVYMDIANSITTVFQQLCGGEQNEET